MPGTLSLPRGTLKTESDNIFWYTAGYQYALISIKSQLYIYTYLVTALINTTNEDELSNEETNAQVHMNIIPHAP